MRLLPAIFVLLLAAALGATHPTPAPAAAGAPTASAIPTITGNRRVTQELRVSPGRWRGKATTYRYRWVTTTQRGRFTRSGAIRGAFTNRYTVRVADAGRRIAACVQAVGAGGKASAWSCAYSTRIVPPGNTVRPTARGVIRANAEVRGDPGRWRAATRGVSYAWQTSNDGVTWKFASGGERARITYRVAPDEVGLALRLRVIGRNLGGNSLPVTSNVIAPQAPRPTSDRQALISSEGGRYVARVGDWEGGIILQTRYEWQTADSPEGPWSIAPGSTDAATYTPPRPDVARHLRVVVTRTNGGGSTALASEPVALPTAPTVIDAPTISGETREGETLSAAEARFGGEVTTRQREWLRCDDQGEACASTGRTDATYLLGEADATSRMRVREVASNAIGSTPALSEPTAIIIALAPRTLGAPSIPPQIEEGVHVTVTAGSWQGVISERRWQWEQEVDGQWQDIVGATAAGFVPTDAQFGLRIRVRETVQNNGGSATDVSAASDPVGAVPSLRAPPAVSGDARPGQELSASTGDWRAVPAAQFTYQWETSPDGVAWGPATGDGATGDTYTVADADGGHQLRVVVSARNDFGAQSAASDATVMAAPVATAPLSTCDTPQVGSSCDVSGGGWIGASALTYTWQYPDPLNPGEWLTIGSPSSAPSFAPDEALYDSPLRVIVTASNAGPYTTTVISPVTPQTLPAAPAITTSSNTCSEPQVDIECSGAAATYSGQGTITRTYQWEYDDPTLGWTAITGASGTLGGPTDDPAALPLTPDPDQYDTALRLVTSAANTGGTTQSISDSTAPTLPAAPSAGAGAAAINCTPPRVDEPCSGAAGSWNTQGPTSYTYTWQVNTPGGWIDAQTTTTTAANNAYTPIPEYAGLPLRLAISASNPGGSASSTGGSLVIAPYNAGGADAPSACPSPQAGLACTGSPGTWLGEPSSYRYQWQRQVDGVWQDAPGATSLTYTPGADDADHPLRLQVFASYDGSESAAAPSAATPTTAGYPVLSGGTLTSDEMYYYRTFTSSADLDVTEGRIGVDALIVGGGGAGGIGGGICNRAFPPACTWGGGGGGGAGAVRLVTAIDLAPDSTTSVTVGAGGVNTPSLTRAAEPSVFADYLASGGLNGLTGSEGAVSPDPITGGSGGGGGGWAEAGEPTGLPGGPFGFSGGNAFSAPDGVFLGGGGGGAGGGGANGTAGGGGGGGNGVTIFGISVGGGGGGGGGGTTATPLPGGSGGVGGGGSGVAPSVSTGEPGTENTGGGGGGGSTSGGYDGGAGVVVVRYLRSVVGG